MRKIIICFFSVETVPRARLAAMLFSTPRCIRLFLPLVQQVSFKIRRKNVIKRQMEKKISKLQVLHFSVFFFFF